MRRCLARNIPCNSVAELGENLLQRWCNRCGKLILAATKALSDMFIISGGVTLDNSSCNLALQN